MRLFEKDLSVIFSTFTSARNVHYYSMTNNQAVLDTFEVKGGTLNLNYDKYTTNLK